MTAPGAVSYALVDGVAELTLQRPASGNAIDLPLAEAFTAAARRSADDAEAAVLLLRGSGPRLCVGGDVRAMVRQDDVEAFLLRLARAFGAGVSALMATDKPVVTVAHGAVAGAGLALPLAADVAVASRTTTFAAGYPGVGLTPDCGVGWLLPRAVGSVRARELLFTGRRIDGEEAVAIGLATTLAEDDDEALAEGRRIAHALAAGVPGSLAATKALLRGHLHRSFDEAVEAEARAISAAAATEESRRLVARFTSGC